MPDGRKEAYVPLKRHQERHRDVREQAKRFHSERYKIHAVKHHDALQRPTKQDEHHVAPEARPPQCFKAEEEAQGKHSPALTSNVSECKRDAEVVSSSPVAGNDSASSSLRELTFYPAYAHRASPTYFSWVKLTIYDIHHKLQHKEEYLHCWTTGHSYGRDMPLLLFYNNHPIQFVQVIGVIVSFDEYYEKTWLFTMDDGSGATIDVVCRKPSIDKKSALIDENHDEEKELQKEAERLSEQVKTMVKIGVVLQIKGTITLFQRARPLDKISVSGLIGPKARNTAVSPEGTRQLSLQRLVKVCDTAHEIDLIAARNEVYDTVLNKPWNLTEKEQNRLHREALGEVERQRKKIRRRSELQRKQQDEENVDRANIQEDYGQEEQQRALEAERALVAGQNLMQISLQAQNERHNLQQRQRLHADARSNAIEKKAKRNKRRSQNTDAQCQHGELEKANQLGGGSMSFAAHDEEKAALLHAAFG